MYFQFVGYPTHNSLWVVLLERNLILYNKITYYPKKNLYLIVIIFIGGFYMRIFYVAGAVVLLILVPLLLYSTTKLAEGNKTSTYITALLCFMVGLGTLYLGLL
jgi:hypothetical protein